MFDGHTHGSFQNFDVRASRYAVTDGGLTITSGLGQTVLGDTQVLSNGATYDIFVVGHAQLSAGSLGTIEAALDISGTGTSWSPEWLGTGTEGGERGVMVFAVDRAVAEIGQTITVNMVARRGSANGTVGTASFFGWIIAHGTGGVV